MPCVMTDFFSLPDQFLESGVETFGAHREFWLRATKILCDPRTLGGRAEKLSLTARTRYITKAKSIELDDVNATRIGGAWEKTAAVWVAAVVQSATVTAKVFGKSQ